jgi:SnoaL-like domain
VSFVDPSPVVEPVTGKEQNIDPTEPFGALAEYYRAFNSRSIQLMELNWSGCEDVSMASPLGGTQNGWVSISRIYRKLFRGTHILTLELHDYSIHEVGETFLVVGRERGCYMNNAIALGLTMRSSRWFRRVYGRWRQYHHHGSIDDANLLARLQGLFGDRAAES